MSFLDDSSATLQEALAFIDAHESSIDSSSGGGAVSRPRKSPKLGYWERLKAESESLRVEAAALETTLKQLQGQMQAKVPDRVDREQWMLVGLQAIETATLAEQEHQRRLQAESTNSRLKDLVARNFQSIETLTSRATTDGIFTILPALLKQVTRLEAEALAILDRVGLLRTESFLFHSQRHMDPLLGSVVEAVSSTPLLISTLQADVALWRRFTHDLELGSNQTNIKLIEGGFTKSHPSTFVFGGERFELTTHMMLRRHVHAGIMVNVWTALTEIPNTNTRFIEESLISVRDPTPGASVSAVNPALLQCWYRIHAEEDDTPCAESHGRVTPHLELLKENAMRLRSNLGMGYIQSLESLLMNEPVVEQTVAHMTMIRA